MSTNVDLFTARGWVVSSIPDVRGSIDARRAHLPKHISTGGSSSDAARVEFARWSLLKIPRDWHIGFERALNTLTVPHAARVSRAFQHENGAVNPQTERSEFSTKSYLGRLRFRLGRSATIF
jgi:hypothetical protein